MSAIMRSNFAIKVHSTVEAENGPDGASAGTAANTTETTVLRAGGPNNATAVAFPGTTTATSYRTFGFPAPTAGTTLYASRWFRTTALPSSAATIMDFGGNLKVELTSAGKLRLMNGAVQVGSDSLLTIAVDTGYIIQLGQKITAGAADVGELRVAPDDTLDIETVATDSALAITDTQPTTLRLGWITAPGVTATQYAQDVMLNDSTGTYQKSWSDVRSRIGWLEPTYTTSSAGWLHCGNIASAVNVPIALRRRPPEGHAHATSHTTYHQYFYDETTPLASNVQAPGQLGIPGHYLGYPRSGTLTFYNLGETSTVQKRAFGFFAAGTVDYFEASYSKIGSPTDNLVLELFADDGGKPGTLIATIATKPGTELTGTETRYRFPVTGIDLTGQKYWYSEGRSGAVDAANYYRGHPYNVTIFNAGFSTWNGSTWTVPANPGALSLALNVVMTTHPARLATYQAWCCHGEAVTTATQAGTISGSDPTLTAVAFNFGDDLGAAGVFPANWRWAKTAFAYDLAQHLGVAPTVRVTKTTSSTRNVMVCSMGAYLEYTLPPSGWVQYQKTADSTLHWVKVASLDTVGHQADDAAVTAQGGSCFITPDPIPDEGNPTSLAAISEHDLLTLYTPV